MNRLVTAVVKSPWLKYDVEHGWGNGYVLLPDDHILYGKSCDELNQLISVHNGVTCARILDQCRLNSLLRKDSTIELSTADVGKWLVGFDTGMDTLQEWPKCVVLREVHQMEQQLRYFTYLMLN